jgi:hypothetical protein
MGRKSLNDLSLDQARIYGLAFAILAIVETELEIESLSGEATEGLVTAIDTLEQIGDPLKELPQMRIVLKEAQETMGSK